MDHRVASHDEWLAARRMLRQKEKEFTSSFVVAVVLICMD
jgi:predicted dithiol-disulfide oxidoreductase (DUF899 family)